MEMEIENQGMSLSRRITDEVRAQIAFEVFRTTPENKKNRRVGSYTEIAETFGCTARTVLEIAREWDVERTYTFKPTPRLNTPGYKQNRDIEKVNWTFNTELKLERVKRKEQNLVNQVHESMSKLAELS